MSFYDGARDFLAFIVRAIGLVLLLFGLWLALEVLHEACDGITNPPGSNALPKPLSKAPILIAA
ncbi:MAG: hypothetical protein U5P41_04210 [Gammaproteobacteria bacterium]|nr:hypothetical protein [Gammaproteobacteria bacterium]